jgi:hypothetical protein
MEEETGKTSLLSDLISTLCSFYIQYKKAELLKKLPNTRISTDPEINNLHKLISTLGFTETNNAQRSDIFEVLDIKVRAIVCSLNERISCLWNYRDEESKQLNILTLCRDMSVIDSSLQCLHQVIGKEKECPSWLSGFIEECVKRILPRYQRRLDHMLSQYTEALVARLVLDYLQQYPQYFCEVSRQRTSPVLQLCCSSSDDIIAHDSRPPANYDDLTVLLSSTTIKSFKEAKSVLTVSSSLDLSRSYRLMVEHSLQAILSTFLTHTIAIDEGGLERFHRLLLFYKQLANNDDAELPLLSLQTNLTWRKAKAVFEVVKGFIYQTSEPGKKLPYVGKGGMLSQEEVIRWRNLVKSTSAMTFVSGRRKKKKASVFIAMELD